jgi:hypothetical protein
LFTGDESGMQRLQGKMDKITSVYSYHYRCINQKSKRKTANNWTRAGTFT